MKAPQYNDAKRRRVSEEVSAVIYDIAVIVILILAMIIGHRRGFFRAAIYAGSWLGAIVCAVFTCGKVSSFLGGLFLNDMVRGAIDDRFEESAEAIDRSFNSLPELIRGGMVVDASGTVAIFTAFLTKIIVMAIVFPAIVIAVRLLLRIVIAPILSRRRKGVLGSINRMLGLLLGFIEGFIIIFIGLAVLMVVVNMASPEVSEAVSDGLETSYVAGALYDNNLLILLARAFI